MTDTLDALVERLRHRHTIVVGNAVGTTVFKKAADAIAALRVENAACNRLLYSWRETEKGFIKEREALQGEVASLCGQCGDLNHANDALRAERDALQSGLDKWKHAALAYFDVVKERDALRAEVNFTDALLESANIKWAKVESERDALRAEVAECRKLAQHLRDCLECGEMDVSYCSDGRPLWDAAMKYHAKS